MMRRRKYSSKTLIKTFAEYGIHLWIILLLANVVLLYAFQFYTRADENCLTHAQVASSNRCLYIYGSQVIEKGTQDEPFNNIACGTDLTNRTDIGDPSKDVLPYATQAVCTSDLQTESTVSIQSDGPTSSESAEPTKVPEPVGPIAHFSFSLPGIGSDSANLDPIRKTRDVTIFLYSSDENPSDNRIKPVYTFKTRATYDADIASPTYSQYVNKNADLGDKVKNGRYQVVLKTDQSLRKIVKENEKTLGGKVFTLSQKGKFEIAPQKLITGDIAPPEGDNAMDINDYNAFVTCFAKQESCTDPLIADIDDNGSVDGTDYNLLLLNFRTLLEQGLPVPSLDSTPVPTVVSKLSDLTKTPTKKPEPAKKPTAAPTQTAGSSSGAGLIVGTIVMVLFIAIVVVAILKRKTILALISRKHELTPPDEGTEPAAEAPAETQTPEASGETSVEESPEQAEPQEPTAEAPAEPSAPEPEQPTEPSAEEQTPEPATETPTETPEQPEAPAPLENPQPQQPEPAPAPPEPASEPQPEATQPTPEAPSQEQAPAVTESNTVAAAPASDAKEYYVKKGRVDDQGSGFWLTLTDDKGPIEGHYSGRDAKDGFAMVIGEMKDENGKSYMEVSSLSYED